MLAKSLHLIVGTLLLSIAVRTWLVMGLVAPVMVSGSSMVPTLRGKYVVAHCPRCEMLFDVGAEFAAHTTFAACPRCTEPFVRLTALPFQASDRLWIDRTAFARRAPRRWEVAVWVCPHDAAQLCVKRVVGLAGESVFFAEGDVWVNGEILRKSLAEQSVLRQVVHVADGIVPRWKAQNGAAWRWQEVRWQCQADEDGEEHWLQYAQLKGQPVTDDSSYNAGVSRRLNRVRDFMLGGKLRVAGEAAVALEIDDGQHVYRAIVQPSEEAIRFEQEGELLMQGHLSALICDQLQAGEPVEIVFSNFDRQLLLALGGHVELEFPLPEGKSPTVGSAEPVAVGAWGGMVSLEGLALYRDVYYDSPTMRNAADAVSLGRGEYFLLGDNAPISVDSRRWGPVPGRLLLGKPMGVR